MYDIIYIFSLYSNIFHYIPLYIPSYFGWTPIFLRCLNQQGALHSCQLNPQLLQVMPPKKQKKTSLESLSHVICCFNPNSSHSSSFNQPPMSSPQIPCHLHHRRATMLLVTDVPILAPMIMGIAWVTESTSAPTKPTTMLVLVEELWTKTVAKMPTMRPALERLNIKRQI